MVKVVLVTVLACFLVDVVVCVTFLTGRNISTSISYSLFLSLIIIPFDDILSGTSFDSLLLPALTRSTSLACYRRSRRSTEHYSYALFSITQRVSALDTHPRKLSTNGGLDEELIP